MLSFLTDISELSLFDSSKLTGLPLKLKSTSNQLAKFRQANMMG